MLLTDDDLEEFIALWRDEFGETITPDAARKHASSILTLCELLLERPSDSRRNGPTLPSP